jgi:hypothetical protein
MNVEIFLAGVAASAVLIAYVADRQHRKRKRSAAAVAATFVKEQRESHAHYVDSGLVHFTPPAALRSYPTTPRPAESARAMSDEITSRRRAEYDDARRSSYDEDALTRTLVTAIVVDSLMPDPPASSSHDTGSSWGSSHHDTGSSSYDSGSSSSYDSGSVSSDTGGGGGW